MPVAARLYNRLNSHGYKYEITFLYYRRRQSIQHCIAILFVIVTLGQVKTSHRDKNMRESNDLLSNVRTSRFADVKFPSSFPLRLKYVKYLSTATCDLLQQTLLHTYDALRTFSQVFDMKITF